MCNFVLFSYETAPWLFQQTIVFSHSFVATRATRHPDSVINGGRKHKATTAPRGAETASKWRDMAHDGRRHGPDEVSRELQKGGAWRAARAVLQYWAKNAEETQLLGEQKKRTSPLHLPSLLALKM